MNHYDSHISSPIVVCLCIGSSNVLKGLKSKMRVTFMCMPIVLQHNANEADGGGRPPVLALLLCFML